LRLLPHHHPQHHPHYLLLLLLLSPLPPHACSCHALEVAPPQCAHPVLPQMLLLLLLLPPPLLPHMRAVSVFCCD
jgi:hypothetical protein